jgi:acyl-CoA synthetase (AMP-forming)/AMP-acid ligase II
MLSRLLSEVNVPPEQDAIVEPGRRTGWGELRGRVRSIGRALQTAFAGRRVGLSFQPAAESYATLAAMDQLSCDAFLFDAHLSLDEALKLARKLKLGAFLSPRGEGTGSPFEVHELPGEARWSGSTTVTILTSGSTGEPKAVRHSWEGLGRPVRKGPVGNSPRWFLAYRPHLYAGLQVALQCFADGGTLIAPDPQMDACGTAEFMAATRVQFASATPSYWRRFLVFSGAAPLERIPLVQITVGGEVADQPLLNSLRRHFPKARLVHIYATTELGRCFSVTDGLAGFPTRYLDRVSPDGVELRVSDGQLFVRSRNSMCMYDPHSLAPEPASEYFATGDLVEIRGDRVYFAGRKSDMINVAGSKVHPIEVERVIRMIPGVSDVRVFGKASSIAGELVACEIVPSDHRDPEVLKKEVMTICRAQLATYQQPRVIKFVGQIDLSLAGKTVRGTVS